MLVRKLFFLPEEVIMKRMNFLIGMVGISLALGMMVIGCDTGSGGGSNTKVKEGDTAAIPERTFLSTQVPHPEASPPLVFAFTDPDTGNAVGVYNVGYIANQIIAYSYFHYNGMGGASTTLSLTTTNETVISNTITNSVETSVSAGATATVSTGVEVGVDVDMLTAKVKKESSLGVSLGTAVTKLENYQSTKTVRTTETFSQIFNYNFENYPVGHYVFGAFSYVDYYLAVSVNPSTKTVVGTTLYQGINSGVPELALEYSATSPTARDGLAISDNKKLNVDFTADPVKIIEEAAKQVGGIKLPIDVWGKKKSYSYKVLAGGELRYTLVGGGAGGAGAAAARDTWTLFWGDTQADAGWSADGGPTILKVNGAKIAQADGGAKVNGPDLTAGNEERAENGVKGNDGKEKSDVLRVIAGDEITIEVGYGGGGSGGAAANDTQGSTSSGSAEETLGSDGKSAQTPGKTSAEASRGGMGGMHSLFSTSTQYTSDLQKGSDSSAASSAAAAAGGQTRGAGGAAGNKSTTGGMYASGGGGGAAGGFTLTGSNVVLTEK
jgi:hypothetical protein